jgi:predicted acetyltransferase
MLQEALKFCARIGIERVLITCDKTNPASAGVITHCGGIMENEIYDDKCGEVIQRYWIENRCR